MEEQSQCLMCRFKIEFETPPSTSATEHTVRCKRCGRYRISQRLAKTPHVPNDLKPYLSAATRQASDAGKPVLLDVSNLEDLAALHSSVTVSQKVDKALRFAATKCRQPGIVSDLDSNLDYPVADCKSSSEFDQYIGYLVEKNLLRRYSDELGEPTNSYAPTIEGWQAIEPTLPVAGEPKRCFVAMWFSDDLDSVYEAGFAKAIKECGFEAYRVKGDPTNKGIIDKILSEIRRARFVVADFTGQRQSVYYEAGFAHGLGREVIGCCRSGEAKELAFDTRHLGHVVWSDAADLREKLANSIRANIIPKR